jgi:hypothetical protein
MWNDYMLREIYPRLVVDVYNVKLTYKFLYVTQMAYCVRLFNKAQLEFVLLVATHVYHANLDIYCNKNNVSKKPKSLVILDGGSITQYIIFYIFFTFRIELKEKIISI